MPSRGQVWTEEQIEQLKELHGKGLSCAMMAAEIGGFTRNAIIGKLHRLGLSNSKSKVWKDRWANRPKSEKPANRKTVRIVRANGNSDRMRFMESPATDIRLRCIEVVPMAVAFADLDDNGCRYPDGEGPFTFCNHPQIDGSRYCGPHWALTRTTSRKISEATKEQRRRNFRHQHKLSLMESVA